MKISRLLTVVSVATLLAVARAVAGEIYKWTDDDGNVHYEDRPIGESGMERMEIVSQNTDNSAYKHALRLTAKRETQRARWHLKHRPR